MGRILMRRIILLVCLIAGCSPIRGCVESQFKLAPDSRLPSWFAQEASPTRSDVTVELTYWTNGDAVFELKSRIGNTLRKVSGPSCWHPATRYIRKPDGTFAAPGGPEYIIAKVADTIDVVEHDSHSDVFRMSNDKTILEEAKASVARGECRREP